MIETIEIKADQLLEAWSRDLGDSRPGIYPATALDGNLALTETKNYRTKAILTATGKESRKVSVRAMVISRASEDAEEIMRRIKAVDRPAYEALALSYRVPSLRDVGRIMSVGYGKARELRHRGFSMFCVMLDA